MKIFGLVGVLSLCFSYNLCFAKVASGEHPDLSVSDLKRDLIDTHKKIESMSVKYTSIYDEGYKNTKNSYLYKIIKTKKPSFYSVNLYHGHDGLNWYDDPFQQAAVLNGVDFSSSFRLKGLYHQKKIQLEHGLPGSLPDEFIFQATGIWPFDIIPPPRRFDKKFLLRDIADLDSYEKVSKEPINIDGHPCIILENPGHDRLWLDISRHATLLRRELCEPLGGNLVLRYELSEHREMLPGVWLPTRIRNTLFDYNSPSPEGRKRAWKDAWIEVSDWSVNDISEDEFQFRPDPGSIDISKNRQRTSKEKDFLKTTILWLKSYYPADDPKLIVNHDVIIISCGSVVCFLMAFCGKRVCGFSHLFRSSAARRTPTRQ